MQTSRNHSVLSVLSLTAALVATAVGLPAARAERTVRALDEGWRFHRGDTAGAEEPSFDDRAWQQIDVPHDWAITGPFDEDNPARGDGAFLPTGVAWYRKSLELPATKAKQQVFVEFDGVMANSEVWINGRSLGTRPNGYVSFRYDLTDHLRRGDGETNVLAVRTDTSAQIASRWYTGSGIYRRVRLIVVDPHHIDPSDVLVATPRVGPDSATIVITVDNRWPDSAANVSLRTHIIDDTGREVGSPQNLSSVITARGSGFQTSIQVSSPKLWDLDTPHLYSAATSIVADGRTADEVITPFGIRSAVFKPETGFWLNGRNIKIKGVCLHADGGAFGAAVPLAVWRVSATKTARTGRQRNSHGPQPARARVSRPVRPDGLFGDGRTFRLLDSGQAAARLSSVL